MCFLIQIFLLFPQRKTVEGWRRRSRLQAVTAAVPAPRVQTLSPGASLRLPSACSRSLRICRTKHSCQGARRFRRLHLHPLLPRLRPVGETRPQEMHSQVSGNQNPCCDRVPLRVSDLDPDTHPTTTSTKKSCTSWRRDHDQIRVRLHCPPDRTASFEQVPRWRSLLLSRHHSLIDPNSAAICTRYSGSPAQDEISHSPWSRNSGELVPAKFTQDVSPDPEVIQINQRRKNMASGSAPERQLLGL